MGLTNTVEASSCVQTPASTPTPWTRREDRRLPADSSPGARRIVLNHPGLFTRTKPSPRRRERAHLCLQQGTKASGAPSPPAAAGFSVVARPRCPARPAALPADKLFNARGAAAFGPGISLFGSGRRRRRRGDGVTTRVEGQGESGCAQTITVGSKPQNIYLFQPNDSIKWTPAMFLA